MSQETRIPINISTTYDVFTSSSFFRVKGTIRVPHGRADWGLRRNTAGKKKGICEQLVLPLVAHPFGFMLLSRYVFTGNKYNVILWQTVEQRIKSPPSNKRPHPTRRAPGRQFKHLL